MILTYKYRIKDRTAKKALRLHAYAVNQVWNYCCAQQRFVERSYRSGARKRRWASSFDLQKQTAGTSKSFGILANTIGAVCDRFALARDKARHAPRFRSSFGPRRALGWIPFKSAEDRRVDGNRVRYLGKWYRFWLGGRPVPATAKGGAFVEDARGRWYVCFQVEAESLPPAPAFEIGIDLGLKSLATTSDGEVFDNQRITARYAEKLAVAQRAHNKRRVTALHAKIKNVRRDYLHKVTTRLARANSLIVVGDVNSSKLVKTKMAKSVLDASWSELKALLAYKASRHAGRLVIVNESFTTQTCSSCGALPPERPKGIAGLGIREWDCSSCGASHDRDLNAAKNILKLGRAVPPPVEESRGIAA